MNELLDLMFTHRANQHPLFAYLHTHASDPNAWEIFATHYTHAVGTAPFYFALLRLRLPLAEREIFDHLVETTAPGSMLVPPGFFPLAEGLADIRDDLDILPAVEAFVDYHATTMKVAPLPAALGVLYSHCQQTHWITAMDVICTPYLERLDLIRTGLEAALGIRAQLWDGIESAIANADVPF
jgi:hypothetical protein